MTDAGSVQVTARLSLERLVADAKQAQALLAKALKDVELQVDVETGNAAAEIAKIQNAGSGLNTFFSGVIQGAGQAAFFALQNSIQQAVAALQNFVNESLAAAIEIDKVNNKLTLATGSTEAAADAYQFASDTAAKFGLNARVATEAFGDLAISAKGTAIAGENVKELFIGLSAAFAQNGLSADQQKGAFLALQQIISKGTVSAEELRGQLGERLPGAFQIAARAVGVTTAELGKLLQTGSLTADEFIPKFAQQLQTEFAGGAINEAVASINALDSEIFNLQVSLGKALQPAQLAILNGLAEALGKAAGESDAIAILTDAAQRFADSIANNPQLINDFATALVKLSEGLAKVAAGFLDVAPTLLKAITLLVDNGDKLASIIEVLTIRFLALKAVAIAGMLQQAAIASGVLATGAGGAAVSMSGLAVAGKAAVASLAPLLIQLAAIAVAIEGIKFAKFALDMASSNEAIEEFSNGIQASTGAAISAAERTKGVIDGLNKAKQEGRALTAGEIKDAQDLVKANELRISQLEEQLRIAENLPTATEEQRNSQQALIAQINTSINSLKKQTTALDALTTATTENTTATAEQATGVEDVGAAYDRELAALETALKERQTAIATSAQSEDDLRQQNLAAEQEYLNQRVALNQRKLAELQQAQQATSDPKQLEAIGTELAKTEQAINDDRLRIAQQGAQGRIDAAKQAVEDQKAAEEQAEADRKAAQEKALADFKRANENATRAVENSQNQRVTAVREAQLAGVLSAEDAEKQIQQIQSESVSQTIAAKESEIARVNALRAQGVISAEDAADREAQLTTELGQLKLNQIESELEAQRAARAEIIAGIEAEAQARSSKLQGQSGQLDLRGGSLQSELELLSARNELASALGGLEQERLNTQIAIAEAAGNSEQVERLKEQQLRLQSQQLDRQYAAQKEQLRIQQELKKIELEREKLNAQIAVVEAEAALAKAETENVSDRELNALKQVLNLRRQQVGAIDDAIGSQDELNRMQEQVIDAQYQTAQQQQQQARIRQRAEQQDTEAGTEAARSTRPQYNPATQFLGRDGRVYNRQSNASTSNASRLLQTPAIPADSPLKQPGISGQTQGTTTAATLVSVVNLTEVTTRLDRIQGILASVGLRPNLNVSSPQPIADAARVYADIASKAANI